MKHTQHKVNIAQNLREVMAKDRSIISGVIDDGHGMQGRKQRAGVRIGGAIAEALKQR
jgi:hypothetical protein